MSDRRFIRVLTDSTNGRRLLLTAHYEIPYTGAAGLTSFVAGDIVTGATSAAVGTINKVFTTSISAGSLSVTLDPTDENTSDASFVAGEDIKVLGSTIAQVAVGGGYPVYQQHMALTSIDDPNHGAVIDHKGAVNTKYSDGSPIFDSFGKLQVSNETVLAEYISKYSLQENLWYDETAVGATLTHEPDHRATLLSTNSSSGSLVFRTSHLYHPYHLGISQTIEMTVGNGDIGKSGSFRGWGYGDDRDGLFFALDGTMMNILERSSVTGGVVNNLVPQNSWTKDRLDGSNDPIFNISGVDLDVTRDIIYWIDYQWLGAGRVRYGVVVAGEKIVCHEQYHSNILTRPYMRSGDLPVRVWSENQTATTSTSELRYWGIVVKTATSELDPITHRISRTIDPNEPTGDTLPGGSIYQKRLFNFPDGRPLASLRPNLLMNSITNRSVAKPHMLSISNLSNYHVDITVHRVPDLVGSTWLDFSPSGSTEIDVLGEYDSTPQHAESIANFTISPNKSSDILLSDVFVIRCNKIILGADGVDQDTYSYSFGASILSDATNGDYTSENVSFVTQTITRATGSFTADGFSTGEGLHVGGSVSNDGYYMIAAVGTTTMTIEAAKAFTAETTTLGVKLQSGATGNVKASLRLSELF